MRCYVITKGKRVITKNVKEKEQFLIYGEGCYKLDGRKVNLSYKEGKINPTPEILFFENDPLAYNPSAKPIDETKIVSESFLKNFFESTSESTLHKIFGMLTFAKDHAKILIIVGFGALFVVAFFMSGGFKGI